MTAQTTPADFADMAGHFKWQPVQSLTGADVAEINGAHIARQTLAAMHTSPNDGQALMALVGGLLELADIHQDHRPPAARGFARCLLPTLMVGAAMTEGTR
jgi:hypothetical protein